MIVALFKGSAVESIAGVVGCNVLQGETPMIQIIHENATTKTVHCDLYQSAEYTQMSVTFSLPQNNQGE